MLFFTKANFKLLKKSAKSEIITQAAEKTWLIIYRDKLFSFTIISAILFH